MHKRNCPSCNKIITYKRIYEYNKAIQKDTLCMSCTNKKSWKNEAYREKMKKTQEDRELREKRISAIKKTCRNEEYREKMREKSKKLWEDDEYKEKHKKSRENPKCKEKQSEKQKEKWQDEEYRDKISKKQKEKWQDEEYRKRESKKSKERWQNKELRDKQSKISKEKWQDEEYKKKRKEIQGSKEYKEKQSKSLKERWQDPEYREEQIEIIKERWKDPKYREKQAKIRQTPEWKEKQAKIRANQPKVSNIQETLYSILDNLGVKYYREHNDKSDDKECTVGWYSFDCVIPRKDKSILLIECQGDYWHSLPKAIKNDQSKLSYINNNFPGQYEIKYLWEHEFYCKDRVVELIKYWLDITKYEIINYDFEDIVIKKSAAKDYRPLLEKYHYLNNAGRGGVAYGAYHNDELISVVVFSPPIRQNININKKFLELSRFCIHPKYQKKNLGSWFISRAIKLLKRDRSKIEAIISYVDTTFNHDGALYKSLNFTQDKIVKPDYWYVDNNGYVMHKRTLYGKARNLQMKEKDFAKEKGYHKVFGKEKLRFIFTL